MKKLSDKQEATTAPPSPAGPRAAVAHRQVTRRRKSSRKLAAAQKTRSTLSLPMGYLQLRGALAMPAQAGGTGAGGASLAALLLAGATQEHLCDVELAGRDGASIRAPRFLLACHSAVLEELLCPQEGAAARHASAAPPVRVGLEFASQAALDAALHFFATLDLPPAMEAATDAANARVLAQLHLLARLLQVPALLDAAHRAARRLLNREPALVCAAFDECTALAARAAAAARWGQAAGERYRCDDLRAYCREYMRESPVDTVLGAGVGRMGVSAIGDVVRDQEIDVDEYGMWRILNAWVLKGPGTKEEKMDVARSLVSHIELAFIDPEKLKFVIKKCGFVDPHAVEEALQEIEVMLANESPDDTEHVIVEGAGDDRVNGVYFLADYEVGLKTDEVMFLKEGGDGDDFSPDFGLYCLDKTWNISDCADYFNVLYSCAVIRNKGHSRQKPPMWGWKCAEGPEIAPTCAWKPSKEEENADPKRGIVPALLALAREEETDPAGSLASNHAQCGLAKRESLTLSQMMFLPEDAESSGRFRYPSVAKDLDAMMDMPVDEGHDDEEAGYDVNYMSAKHFWNSSDLSNNEEPSGTK